MKRVRIYLLRHVQVFFYTLGQLVRAPLASLMTIAVIGVTLALPTGLYLVVNNLQHMSRGWDTGGQISLFLKQEVSDATARRLAERIRGWPEVARVDVISSDAALAEFKRLSGFGETLNTLGRNPLPAVLVVHPVSERAHPDIFEALLKQLRAREEVDVAQLDLEWVRRLHAMLKIAERAVLVLAGILGLAVLLTIGNTIRLAVLNRRDEIEVTKLLGGTNAFIRRPFLYSGLLQGMFGAFTTWLLIGLTGFLLARPVRELALLYASDFEIRGLGWEGSLILIALGGLLGWFGSRLAVGRHLRAVEPR